MWHVTCGQAIFSQSWVLGKAIIDYARSTLFQINGLAWHGWVAQIPHDDHECVLDYFGLNCFVKDWDDFEMHDSKPTLKGLSDDTSGT